MGVFGYMFDYPMQYHNLLIIDDDKFACFIGFGSTRYTSYGLATHFLVVGWLKCRLSISTRLLQFCYKLC